eukprot:TRINITY_DN695_c0_g1_i2.p1 TRINITY_DN695_c0_g1~~TRINITY_DN695_c0_g1_i2.p1  ORF type:complete len:135 (+),score=37.27 TRINITY_DN695_c0_g1_i2:248-652(+)
MLRRVATTAFKPASRAMSVAPQASDRWVDVTFVNAHSGERWPVTGLEGQTLLDLARANNIGLRGGTTRASHVCVSKEFEGVVPTTNDMIDEIDEYIPSSQINTGSRLADQVVLTKDMRGMNVAVPLPEGPAEFP